jgi:hypothetical protein
MLRPRTTSSKNVKVINDLPLYRILEELDKADNSYTKVGYPMEGDVKKGNKTGSGREQSETISEIAEIAMFLEFGTKDLEGWPFMSTAFDENIIQINAMKKSLYNKIIDGKMTARQALGLIGEFLVSKTKLKIRDIKTPPNKPSTIRKKKGADNPLIDTAQMLNSLQHTEVKLNFGPSRR